MNRFVRSVMGHYLMDAAEEGADLSGSDEGQEEQEQEEGEDDQEDDGDGQEGDEDDGVVVTIGDEPEQEEQDEKAAPAWVKDLRKAQRELQKENRELKAKLEQSAPKPKAIEVGTKPTLEGCDYDGDKFEQELTAWHDRKRQAEQSAKQQEDEQKAQQEAWKGRLDSYATAKAALKVKDFADAEEVTTSVFNEVQQALIIDAADNPALVIYALGKNPAKAKELAAITSHTKFLREISRLEDTKLKVQNRKAPPAPERTVSGTGKISGTTDSTLERLRTEAEKTGDLSKVLAYKRQQRDKKKG